MATASTTRAEATSQGQRLDSLTGLRFFAAAIVVLFHMPEFAGIQMYGVSITEFGYLGVEFFFVLSGFVLIWTARPDDTARRFWRRRLARIYPLYLVSFLPGVVIAVMGKPDISVLGFAASVVMLQAWIPRSASLAGLINGNSPGWSLSAEAFFYAIFPAIAPRMQRLRTWLLPAASIIVFGLMLAAAGVDHHFARFHDTLTLFYFPAFQVGFFLIGMLLGEALRRGVRFPPLWLGTGALVLVWALYAVAARRHLSHWFDEQVPVELLTLPFIVLLVGTAARTDILGTYSPFRHRWIVRLGVWSYALYLVQYPTILIVRKIRSPIATSHAGATIEGLCLLALCVGVAGIMHKLVEEPMNRRLRHAPPSIIDGGDEPAGYVFRAQTL